MRKIILPTLLTFILFSCQTSQSEREIGFHPNPNEDVKNTGWYLGTQEAIDVVLELDKVWKERKYDEATTFFADSVRITAPNGKRFLSASDFMNGFKENENAERITWDISSISSLDISPNQGGEHVGAWFNMKYTDSLDKVTEWKGYESYYVVDGKVVWLDQFRQNPINTD
jgi:hypothetical protein|tara:strand:- start:5066 stop:5578 length:513 start_codon:yes stop_codon:yes gene_type:complete